MKTKSSPEYLPGPKLNNKYDSAPCNISRQL